MPKDSPSMTKNEIRRSLHAIIDPLPTPKEVDLLWSFFKGQCAYCGKNLKREERKGHQDHIISIANGGNNEIHNFVLSCNICNGDEKREENWETFLKKKAPDEVLFNSRKSIIESWTSQRRDKTIYEETMNEIEAIIERTISNFEDAVKKIREIKNKHV